MLTAGAAEAIAMIILRARIAMMFFVGSILVRVCLKVYGKQESRSIGMVVQFLLSLVVGKTEKT